MAKEVKKTEQEYQSEIEALNDRLGKFTERAVVLKKEMEEFKHLPDDIKRQYAINNYQMAMAERFIKSGAFPSFTPEQAFVVIKAGQEMGLKEIESLNSLYIVKGRLDFHSSALIGRIIKGGYKIEWLNETKTSVTIKVTGDNGFEAIETADITDQTLQGSKAVKFATKEKLRYHAARMILKFHLPHLITSAGTDDKWHDVDAMEQHKETIDTNATVQEIVFEDVSEEIDDTPSPEKAPEKQAKEEKSKVSETLFEENKKSQKTPF